MAKTTHIDLKGHHPKVRRYYPHIHSGGSIKVVRLVPLYALHLSDSDDELLETMVVKTGCSDSGMWYVDTAGCGMLQANDAEPPPKRGWLHNAMQCAAVLLLGLMLLVWPTSCKKDPKPTPTPEIPTDTIVPEIPNDTISGDTITPGGDTIVIPGKTVKFFYDGGDVYPPMDSICRYANDPEYDTVYIKWTRPAVSGWTTYSFYVACDSLKKRFDMSQKVFGQGRIRPYEIRPDSDSLYLVKGMIQSNRNWLESHNYVVQPVVGDKKSNRPPRY